MSWEQVKTFINGVAQHPLTITIVFVLLCFGCALIIFSKTSLGKKAIIELTKLHKLGEEKASQTLEKVKDIEILANEKIEALKAEYEEKVAVLVSIVNYYEESVFTILEKIPNAHVQKQLAFFKSTYQDKKEEIKNVIGPIYQDYATALLATKEALREEKEEKINFLENKIAELELYVSELKKEEPNDGEREEETNSNPAEETL